MKLAPEPTKLVAGAFFILQHDRASTVKERAELASVEIGSVYLTEGIVFLRGWGGQVENFP